MTTKISQSQFSNRLCIHAQCNISTSLWFDHQGNIRTQFHQHDALLKYISKEQISQLLQIHQIFNKQPPRQIDILRQEDQSYLQYIYINTYIQKIRQHKYNHSSFKFSQVLYKIRNDRFDGWRLINTQIENRQKKINKSIQQFKNQQLLKLKQDLKNIPIKRKEIQMKQTQRSEQLHIKYKRFTQKIKQNPDSLEIYLQRGQLYQQQKKYSNAIQEYNKALQYNPNYSIAYFRRAYSYAKLNQNQKAILDYTKAIQLNSVDYVAFNNRGLLYMNMNQRQKALQDYNESIRLNPSNASAYNNRGYLYFNCKQFSNAVIEYTKSIQLNAQNIYGYINRGIVYYIMNQHQKSLNDFSKAVLCSLEQLINKPHDKNIEQIYSKAYIWRGSLYIKMIWLYTPFARLHTITKYNPQIKYRYFLRGQAYFRLNEFKKAQDNFLKCIEDTNHISHYYLGRIYLNRNELIKAREYFIMAIQISKKTEYYLYSGITNNQLECYESSESDYQRAFRNIESSSAIDYLKVIYTQI